LTKSHAVLYVELIPISEDVSVGIQYKARIKRKRAKRRIKRKKKELKAKLGK